MPRAKFGTDRVKNLAMHKERRSTHIRFLGRLFDRVDLIIKAGLKCPYVRGYVRAYVRPSVRPSVHKKFLRFQ